MTEVVIVAILSLIGTLIGSLGGIIAANKLTNYRIQQLEEKVEKHNKVIERVYNLEKNEAVQSAVSFCAENGKYIGAICAAPSILGKLGLLDGKKATCFPGFEQFLTGAEFTGDPVNIDGNIITARGAGVAVDFGLALASVLCGEAKAAKLRQSLRCI